MGPRRHCTHPHARRLRPEVEVLIEQDPTFRHSGALTDLRQATASSPSTRTPSGIVARIGVDCPASIDRVTSHTMGTSILPRHYGTLRLPRITGPHASAYVASGITERIPLPASLRTAPRKPRHQQKSSEAAPVPSYPSTTNMQFPAALPCAYREAVARTGITVNPSST